MNRMVEAAISISMTNMIDPAPIITYIISPYFENEAKDILYKANLKDELISSCSFVEETAWDEHDEMLPWFRNRNRWFYQQALKLAALEILDYDAFLIQDCDIVTVSPYHPFVGGIPNVRIEKPELGNHFARLYVEEASAFLSMHKVIDESYVSELMPYLKRDYLALKQHIKVLHGRSILKAISYHREIDDQSIKWLSEYEILGIFKDYHDPSWTREEQIAFSYGTIMGPSVIPSVIKFRARPAKFLGLDQINDVRSMIDKLTFTSK